MPTTSANPTASSSRKTLAAARQAAEAVLTDFEGAGSGGGSGTAWHSEQIHEGVAGNLAYDWEIGDRSATEAALAACQPRHAASTSRNNRLIPNAMEPRAALGVYDDFSEEHTLYTTSQNPHLERLVLSAFVQVAPEHKLRVIAPDVGGGFRFEDLRLRGGNRRHLGGAQGPAAGEVDGRPQRVVPGRRTRSRPPHPRQSSAWTQTAASWRCR